MLQQLLARAVPLHQTGRLAEAEPLYRDILKLAPGAYPALHLLGLLKLQQGLVPEALSLMEQALKVQPGSAETLVNYAIALSTIGRHKDALVALDRVIAAQPGNAGAWANRGGVKSKLGRSADALADLDKALALDPRNAMTQNNRGLVLHDLGRYDEALAAYDAMLALMPAYAEGRNNRGLTLQKLGRQQEAIAEFDRVIQEQPGYAGALVNRASALWAMERLDEAMASYARALDLEPANRQALASRSNLLWTRLQALAPAIADLEKLVAVAPDHPYALGDLLHLKMQAGDWRNFESDKARLDQAVRAGKPAAIPYVYQGLCDNPADLLACAANYARAEYPERASPQSIRTQNNKPRIGYLCGEFRAQATMYLAAGLFEAHDRSRFEIIAFDNGRDDGTPTRQRVVAAFDKFISIAGLSDQDAAARIAGEGIDILVNLNGWFGRMRMGVFAHRPAPIQVNYLGFPGTLGASYIDYILADAVVIGPGEDQFYSEKVVRLPHSYQINDDKRPVPAATSRAAHGLAEDAFVFCQFNYGYKIMPDIFACWMRILKATENSVLWLLAGDPLLAENLQKEAARHGVDPGRLVFVPPLELQAHMARLALSDLFLDSLPYNAHTTASDALWMGLPLLTCKGRTFAGRVAASLLEAVGLPELVTQNMEEYENRAIALAKDPQLLKRYRERLRDNRSSAPLFDTGRTTRAIEQAYEGMLRRWQNGEAREGFAVPS